MKTKSVNSFVKRLRTLKATCERAQVKRDRLPYSAFPSDEKIKLNDSINRLCGEIMHTERCIINALLRGAEPGANKNKRGTKSGARSATDPALRLAPEDVQ